MPFGEMTPTTAGGIIAEAGITVPPEQIRVESRDGKWVAFLPGNRLAWFAATEEGRLSEGKERGEKR